ncbi:hypothetical protein Nepgr_007754 [Nepenthes gracilis]|uniref:Trafficking protein particle complex subunit 12 n=1 Tax=Nepenthes gracilis TaxID=150966 RepID=A0AAD3S7S2_NEPGR|nr:hypothetical protein Nepgr_007754 [Nepenthes gracilis]
MFLSSNNFILLVFREKETSPDLSAETGARVILGNPCQLEGNLASMESSGSHQPETTATNLNADPLAITQHYTILNDLHPELSSLQELALRGSWRSILDKVSRARSLSLLRYPHDHLLYLSFNVLALTKLRRFSDALEDIDSLENLDSPSYCYESYPHLYPNRSGSMVPFSLRWLHAQLPSKLGKRQETLDRLYLLLVRVKSQFMIKSKSSNSLDVSVSVWKRREEFVIGTIISHHLSQKEFGVCLALIRDMISGDANNPTLLSKLGYAQMQFGDLEGAKASFDKVRELVHVNGSGAELLSEVGMKNLVSRNKALIYMVGKDYVSAVREYEECIERDGLDVVAINNKAICLMYLRDLSDSIKVLENALERVPTVAVNETLVVNLIGLLVLLPMILMPPALEFKDASLLEWYLVATVYLVDCC